MDYRHVLENACLKPETDHLIVNKLRKKITTELL